METSIVIILLSLVFSAFFSGMEIAFISANKIHIEIEKKQDNFLAKVLSRLTKRPSKFIATMLIGNNIALVVYGMFMGELLMNWFLGMLPVNNSFLQLILTDFNPYHIGYCGIFTEGPVPDLCEQPFKGAGGACLFFLCAVFHYFRVYYQGVRFYIENLL